MNWSIFFTPRVKWDDVTVTYSNNMTDFRIFFQSQKLTIFFQIKRRNFHDTNHGHGPFLIFFTWQLGCWVAAPMGYGDGHRGTSRAQPSMVDGTTIIHLFYQEGGHQVLPFRGKTNFWYTQVAQNRCNFSLLSASTSVGVWNGQQLLGWGLVFWPVPR